MATQESACAFCWVIIMNVDPDLSDQTVLMHMLVWLTHVTKVRMSVCVWGVCVSVFQFFNLNHCKMGHTVLLFIPIQFISCPYYALRSVSHKCAVWSGSMLTTVQILLMHLTMSSAWPVGSSGSIEMVHNEINGIFCTFSVCRSQLKRRRPVQRHEYRSPKQIKLERSDAEQSLLLLTDTNESDVGVVGSNAPEVPSTKTIPDQLHLYFL